MSEFSVSELDYDLPEHLIAQQPTPERGDSRLLVVERRSGRLSDRVFSEIPTLLNPGDVLVLNDTRVVPAKIHARRRTGASIEGLFLRQIAVGQWEVLLRGRGRLRPGESLIVAGSDPVITLQLEESLGGGKWRVAVTPPEDAEGLLTRVGRTPLPPYIRRRGRSDPREPADRLRYQTVFARRPGAVAAPTAGLHFTDELLDAIRAKGVACAWLTLHVGLGTFAPIQTDRLHQHRMHEEWCELDEPAAVTINEARRFGGRIVAVGTTSVRALESRAGADGRVEPGSGWTSVFCYPPYRFRAVDALLTNFHLPRSTLLALVMAFAGVELTRRAYRHTIEAEYRFYSYGDAMLIL